jgi:hypothetical protein
MWTVPLLGRSPRELRSDSHGWSVLPDESLMAFSPYGRFGELWLLNSQAEGVKRILELPASEWLRSAMVTGRPAPGIHPGASQRHDHRNLRPERGKPDDVSGGLKVKLSAGRQFLAFGWTGGLWASRRCRLSRQQLHLVEAPFDASPRAALASESCPRKTTTKTEI